MYDWDDAFAADCMDRDKAVRIAQLAEEGYQRHGRGFVFVESRLEKQAGKAAGSASSSKGFGAPKQEPQLQGTPLPTNPKLRLLSWNAAFIPGTMLDSLGGLFTEQQSVLVPDASTLQAQFGSSNEGGSDTPDVLGALQRALRGQDLSQLRTYVGLPPPSDSSRSGTSSDSSVTAQAAAADTPPAADMQGVRRYEPEAGEVVVLLSARISGKPAVGAEVLVVARGEDGGTVLELPDGWQQMLAPA